MALRAWVVASWRAGARVAVDSCPMTAQYRRRPVWTTAVARGGAGSGGEVAHRFQLLLQCGQLCGDG